MSSPTYKLHPLKPEKHFNRFKASGLLTDSLQSYVCFLYQYVWFLEGQTALVTSETNLHRRIELLDDNTKQLDIATEAFRQDIWGITNKCTVKTMEKAGSQSREQRKRKLRSTLMLKRGFLDSFTNDDTDNNDDKDNNDDLELERGLGMKEHQPLNALNTTSSELSIELSCLSSSGADEDNGWKQRRQISQTEENIETAIEDQKSIPCVENFQIGRELNRSLDISSLERSKRRRTSSTSSHARKFTLKCPSSSSYRSSIDLEPVEHQGELKAISNAFPQSEPEFQTLTTNVQSSNDDEVLEESKEVIEDMGKKASKASEKRMGAWRLSDASDEEPAEEVDIEEVEQIEAEFKNFDIDIVEEPIIKEEDERNTCEEQRDDDTSESEVADAKVRAVGRRNIRTLLTDEKLTEATRIANLREKERLERLELKRKKLDSSQISGADRLVLDATEGSIIAVHPVLFKRMKQHQINGVQFMWDACYGSVEIMRTEPGAGCVLAHCMGLGKTFQVVTLIHTLISHSVTNTRHVLIVCPVSTVLNWQAEFDIGFTLANCKESMNVFIISDCQKDRLSKLKVLRKWWEENGVLIMGYDCYRILTQQSKRVKNKSGFDERSLKIIKAGLVNPGPDLVICDEGHRLKNSGSICSKALKGINTLRRIILTGSPLQNNLLEYYSMVQFAKPDLLGTLVEFKNRFENPITNGQYANSSLGDIQLMKKRSHILHSILKDTVQIYEVAELQHYLPKKKEYVVLVKLHEVQAALYQKYINHFKANRDTQFLLHFHLLQNTWTHPKLLYAKDKMVLDKKDIHEVDTIVIHGVNEEKINAVDLPLGWWKNYVPKDFHNNWDYGPKLKVMIAIVKQCMKHKQKLLIFSSSNAVLDLIEHVLKVVFVDWRLCRDFLRMDATVAPEQRHKFCHMFNQSGDDSNRVFLISQKVCRVGLNLVAANRVLLMDVSWNTAIDTESIFWVYRLGQTRPCYIYRLVSKDTMEEVAYKHSVTKQATRTRNGCVVEETQINRHYSLEDLREMYNFGYEVNEERPTPKLPSDILLANVIHELKKEIFTYHEHESFLANMPEDQLNLEDIKLAWDEFNSEKESAKEQEIVQEIVRPGVYTDSNNQNLLLGFSFKNELTSRKSLTDKIATLQESTSHTSILSNSSTSKGVAYKLQKPTTSFKIVTTLSDLKKKHANK